MGGPGWARGWRKDLFVHPGKYQKDTPTMPDPSRCTQKYMIAKTLIQFFLIETMNLRARTDL